jgi:hypothetical protein
MALDTARTIAHLRSLSKQFDVGAEAATPFYPTIATVMPSDGRSET